MTLNAIFASQAVRLQRTRWKDAQSLADEIYAILMSQDPIKIDSPIQIVNGTNGAPFEIISYSDPPSSDWVTPPEIEDYPAWGLDPNDPSRPWAGVGPREPKLPQIEPFINPNQPLVPAINRPAVDIPVPTDDGEGDGDPDETLLPEDGEVNPVLPSIPHPLGGQGGGGGGGSEDDGIPANVMVVVRLQEELRSNGTARSRVVAGPGVGRQVTVNGSTFTGWLPEGKDTVAVKIGGTYYATGSGYHVFNAYAKQGVGVTFPNGSTCNTVDGDEVTVKGDHVKIPMKSSWLMVAVDDTREAFYALSPGYTVSADLTENINRNGTGTATSGAVQMAIRDDGLIPTSVTPLTVGTKVLISPTKDGALITGFDCDAT